MTRHHPPVRTGSVAFRTLKTYPEPGLSTNDSGNGRIPGGGCYTVMRLGAGTHLGPYEILSPIGAGGMGEVYKAKDTRLDRTVAIKVLPSHLSDNARLKERFEREARAVSFWVEETRFMDFEHQVGRRER